MLWIWISYNIEIRIWIPSIQRKSRNNFRFSTGNTKYKSGNIIEPEKNEKINLPTVGPGPMTASAIITDCGIYEKQMTFLNAPLDQLKDV